MTLNLARNFLLLSFIHRADVLKKLHVLDEDEFHRLRRGNHDEVMALYKLAFGRIKERRQIEALEHAVSNYI
jgi:hypothetical protein